MTKLSWEWVEHRLQSSWNYWLATISPDGRPYVRPVWCIWRDDVLLFTTGMRSRKAQNFLVDPRVSVHPELVREVVVVDGVVEPAEPDTEAIDAYERKYGARPPAGQGWFKVRPSRIYAADEETYPESATSFEV